MRIAVLYNRDVYALKALNRLLPGLTDHSLALFHSSRVGRDAASPPKALTELATFEYGLLDKFSARPALQRRVGFEEISAHFGLRDEPLNDINQPSGLHALASFRPDLMVSIRFGKILRNQAIGCAAKGVINLHSGLLPHYRGVMPTFWAMLAGETHIGMTLHWVPDATIDTGAIIATTSQPCNLQASYVGNVWGLYDAGVDNMLQAINAIDNDELPQERAPGNANAGSYFSFPDASALAAFHTRGLKLHGLRDQSLAD